MKHFENPWNPSWEEIHAWGYRKRAKHPCQDWELALLWKGFEDLYIELASDDSCPKQKFFLSILYFRVGDAVRSKYQTCSEHDLRDFIAKAENVTHANIKLWQERSLNLLLSPESFRYHDWCGGNLAKKSAPKG